VRTSSTRAKAASAAKPAREPKAVRTLAIVIGGTGIKSMVIDEQANPLTERVRTETPHPAVPEAVVDVISEQVTHQGDFDRVSVGFPGVVHEGVVATAPNLDSKWAGFDLGDELEKRFGKPVRVCNDADVQGYAAIEGKGVELVITLGTGLGSGLYVEGQLVPNLELAHHVFRKGRTYEEFVGARALKKHGAKRWRRDVQQVIEELAKVFNFRRLYIGGGNAKKLNTAKLPDYVTVIDNTAGLLGGIALWQDDEKKF
jgi:polyphosphate glucokinase